MKHLAWFSEVLHKRIRQYGPEDCLCLKPCDRYARLGEYLEYKMVLGPDNVATYSQWLLAMHKIPMTDKCRRQEWLEKQA